jgi:hypothetical protein
VREELERLRLEFEALRRTYDERLRQLEQRLIQIGGGPNDADAAGNTDVTAGPTAGATTTPATDGPGDCAARDGTAAGRVEQGFQP